MPLVKSITQSTLNKIEPTGKVQFIRDESLRGFGIKVTAKGEASFFVEGRVRRGRVIRRQFGSVELLSLREAKTEARELLLRLSRGEDIARTAKIEAAPQDSLTKTLERYVSIKTTSKKMKESTAAKYRQQIKSLFSDWALMPVNAIPSHMVTDKYAELVKSGKSVDYVNSGFRTLKALFNHAGVTPNPVSETGKRNGVSFSSAPRNTFLRSDQIRELIASFGQSAWLADPNSPDLQSFLLFILLTGSRKSEALNLRWKDVNGREITFLNTKNKRDHTIPNVGMITDVLASRRRSDAKPEDTVFLLTEDRLKTRLKKAREKGFIGDWTTHDLRRTFAEHSSLAGIDLHQIGMALNHTPVGVTTKSYLGGNLAKLSSLRRMYQLYQGQLMSYLMGGNDEQGIDADYIGEDENGIFQDQIVAAFPNYFEFRVPGILEAMEAL